MVGPNPLRYVAPILLVIVVIGAILIVTNHTGGSTSSTTSAHVAKHQPRPRGKYANATFYTVQPGDNLTAIAAKTGRDPQHINFLNGGCAGAVGGHFWLAKTIPA